MTQESIEALYTLILHACSELRRILGIDNSSSPIPNPENPRTYYIHNVLCEVENCIYSIMSIEGLLIEEPNSLECDKQLNSNIFQAKIDEMGLWRRKFIEHLIDLTGFTRANLLPYYKHRKLLHEYD